MSIAIDCPRTSCGFHTTVKTQLSFQHNRCPKCGTELRRRHIRITKRSGGILTTQPNHSFAEAVFPMRLFAWGTGLMVLCLTGTPVVGVVGLLLSNHAETIYLVMYSIDIFSQACIIAGVFGLAFIQVSVFYTVLMSLSIGFYFIPLLLMITGVFDTVNESILLIHLINVLILPLVCFAQGNFCKYGGLNKLGGKWIFYGFCQLALPVGLVTVLSMFMIENMLIFVFATIAIVAIVVIGCIILLQLWRTGLDTAKALCDTANRMPTLRNSRAWEPFLAKRCISIAIVVIVIVVSWNCRPSMSQLMQ